MWTEIVLLIKVIFVADSFATDLPNFQLKVVGGRSAVRGQFPWQAWLETVTYHSVFATGCGGALITDRHVITAAHCVQGVRRSTVTLGAVDTSGGSGIRTVVRGNSIRPHPGYSSTSGRHDIAVLTLPLRVNPTAYVRPIRLPQPQEGGRFLDGMDAIVSGFGRTSDSRFPAHPRLQYANLQILSHLTCEQFYIKNFGFPIGPNQICTTYKNNRVASVCSGDSGGPLIIKSTDGLPTLVGVVSLGISPCESGGPSVYTSVASYLYWIQAIINSNRLVK